jgi:hypothetical protein
VAKSTLGKTVSRVGSSGGGRTYRRQRPLNFYAVVAVIALLGISLVAYSRYERQNPPSAVFPAINDKGYNGLASEECGTALPNLPNQVGTQTYSVITNNVLQIAPTTASQAGTNATVGEFIKQMPGYSFSTSKMTFPGANGKVSAATTFTGGEKCPTGSKYAGQPAYPVIAVWRTSAQAKPTLTTKPSSVHLSSYMLFSFAFEPTGISPARPSSATISAMFAAGASAAATSTTTTTP